MKTQRFQFLLLFIIMFLFIIPYHIYVKAEIKHNNVERKTYIVHMDKSHMPASFADHHEWYYSSLKSATNSAQLLYSYNNVIHGFSAGLSDEEAQSLKAQPGVLSLMPEARYELHTTRTPEFLGLGQYGNFLPASPSQADVIIGMIDTGVWPEHKSFDDVALGPVPPTWKGKCEEGTNFTSSSCNRKLIGARFFCKGYEALTGPIDVEVENRSPRDDDGHGTHTASTAAGSVVTNASLFGFANGTARGMAPHARIAVYKACWQSGCFTADILMAMDAAIDDGVDILSMSVGGSLTEYYQDGVAMGAFAAMKKGILVSCSAGNEGPTSGLLSNVAPWITTVGAGTIDRDFPAHIILGDGRNFTGASLYSGKPLPKRLYSLFYGGSINYTMGSSFCMGGSLDPKHVKGKIVVCDRGANPRVQKGEVVRKAGGVGMIVANTEPYGEELVADAHLIPAASLGEKEADEIKRYISSGTKPTVTIGFSGTELGVKPSPVVASFSSRGPNPLTPGILKPDLIAPGVNILAGWTGKAGPSGLYDTRHVKFNIISGTSMSCPHVSGLAALVKAAHPEWGPGAIKSALMTTAYTSYTNEKPIIDISTGLPATPFDYGAGHVSPIAALDPGLVYDSTVDDYLDFLCALKYSSDEIKVISNQEYMCSSRKSYSTNDLNYPSFAVNLDTSTENGDSKKASIVEFTRTVTNVDKPATYKASVSVHTTSVKVRVEPELLTFKEVNEKKSFKVIISANSMPSGSISFAHLIWSDGKHTVTSPITFSWT